MPIFKKHTSTELRRDLVSDDWIVIAPKRAKRPQQLIKKKKRIKAPVLNCPFEDPQVTGHGEPIILYEKKSNRNKRKKDWAVQVIQNKYPVFIHRKLCPSLYKLGPFSIIDGVGYHDLVITRDHNQNFAHLTKNNAYLVFKAFQERYKMFIGDSCVAYVSIFHNWGPKAGASIYHPHYQIIAIPVVPPDIEHSLLGSSRFYRKNKKCVHCTMIKWEKKNKSRIVYENKEAIVFTPFVSREPFELRVFPKRHLSYFEDTSKETLKFITDALQKALRKIEKHLYDSDYNFFIHTSPIFKKERFRHYHWHIEIQPKISISAGFELGTGIEITVIDPDEAAKLLRK